MLDFGEAHAQKNIVYDFVALSFADALGEAQAGDEGQRLPHRQRWHERVLLHRHRPLSFLGCAKGGAPPILFLRPTTTTGSFSGRCRHGLLDFLHYLGTDGRKEAISTPRDLQYLISNLVVTST